MIASWQEKLGIIIENTEIADAMKKTYELAWIGAEEESKKLQINFDFYWTMVGAEDILINASGFHFF